MGLVGFVVCGSFSQCGVRVRVQHFAGVPLCYGGGARHRLPPAPISLRAGVFPGWSLPFVLPSVCIVFCIFIFWGGISFFPCVQSVCRSSPASGPVGHVGSKYCGVHSPCGVAIGSFISCGHCRIGCADLRLIGVHVFSSGC